MDAGYTPCLVRTARRLTTILDLSGIPSTVVARLIGAILKIIYEGLFWGREKSEGGIARPLLVVMEEAHRYLSKEADGPARAMVQRIVKKVASSALAR